MANVLYPSARSSFLKGEIDWEDDTIKVVALSSTYTYASTDEFYSDISGVLDTATITGATVIDNGIADADDASFTSVGVGETVAAIVIYKDTGTAATSPLIYFADTNSDGTAISRESTGATITVTWSADVERVFKI